MPDMLLAADADDRSWTRREIAQQPETLSVGK